MRKALLLFSIITSSAVSMKASKDGTVKTPFNCSFLADQFEYQRYECLYLLQNNRNFVEYVIRSKISSNFYTLQIRKNTSKNRKDMFFFFLLRNNEYMKRIKGYKIDDEKDIIYSLSEFCPEGNLQQFLDRYDALTEADVLLIFERIVQSVLAIHINGYIHGDLKLESISMCAETIPKIRTFKTRVVKDSLASKRGTPLYMPPEALMDLFQPSRFFFQKSFDNYALGVILYFMLHYKFPFYGNTYEELVINMSSRRVAVDPDLSPLSKSLLAILLSSDTALRKNTKAIADMIQKETKSMSFSDFRKGSEKPLFELYIPEKDVIKKSIETEKKKSIESSADSKKSKNSQTKREKKVILDVDEVDSRTSPKYKEQESKSEISIFQKEEQFDKALRLGILKLNQNNKSSEESENLYTNRSITPEKNKEVLDKDEHKSEKGRVDVGLICSVYV